MQNAGADKATEEHWCVGQCNYVLTVLTVVKDLIEHHHDQSELKQESQKNVHDDVKPLLVPNFKITLFYLY